MRSVGGVCHKRRTKRDQDGEGRRATDVASTEHALRLFDEGMDSDERQRLEDDSLFHRAVVRRVLLELGDARSKASHLPAPDARTAICPAVEPVHRVEEVPCRRDYSLRGSRMGLSKHSAADPEQGIAAHAIGDLVQQVEEPADGVPRLRVHTTKLLDGARAEDGLRVLERLEHGEDIRSDRLVVVPAVAPRSSPPVWILHVQAPTER
jgi:hypothetical protein